MSEAALDNGSPDGPVDGVIKVELCDDWLRNKTGLTEDEIVEEVTGETVLDNGRLEVTVEGGETGVEGISDTDEAEIDTSGVKIETPEEIGWAEEPLAIDKPLLGADNKLEADSLANDVAPVEERDKITFEAMPAEEDSSVDKPDATDVT